jgi:hypothetical protein
MMRDGANKAASGNGAITPPFHAARSGRAVPQQHLWAARSVMRTLQVHLSLLVTFVFCMNAHAGYTHYFTWHQKPGDTDLKACIDEMRRIIQVRTNILVGPDGASSVIVDPLHVDLNGVGDDAHEPFVFPGEVGFNFCKTEYKPYDAVVTACLLIARDHFPQSVLSISSDGSWSDGDWREGIKLYSSVLGRSPRNPMSPIWRVVGWRISLWVFFPAALVVLAVVVGLRKLLRKL